MSRLAGLFVQLRDAGRAALIPFMTAGDPSLTATVPLMHALVAAGADAIELGMPFSDPMADGPSIQRASERALARGVKLRMVLEWVREFRTTNSHTPVILMGYLNPVEAMGITSFAEAAATAG
ncbi:tryptophan synthase subunit alpha, partial [Acidithiobacillus ferrooxidans]|nr:tryptophan synthase subunit alpha [Acidithiobacillus ferrooxidans]